MTNATGRILSQLTSRILFCGALVVSASVSLQAQTTATPPMTAVAKQFAKIELGLSAVGEFTNKSQGTSYLPQNIYQTPSNTAAPIIDLRYQKSPFVGFELTYTQARRTENYNVQDIAGKTPSGQANYILGVQAKVAEYGFGYMARPRDIFGVHPFAGAGMGAIEFHPTAGGGEGLIPQERLSFYYTVGGQIPLFTENFGLRVQFRQVFYGAPDFNQNYLATGARVQTTEPGVGFYVKF